MTQTVTWSQLYVDVTEKYVRPVKKCASHIGYFSKCQKFFALDVPDRVHTIFTFASTGKSGCNAILFGATIVDLIAPRLHETPNSHSYFIVIGKISSTVLSALDIIEVVAECTLTQSWVAAHGIGFFQTLNFAQESIDLAKASCALCHFALYESPLDNDVSEEERTKRWMQVGGAAYEVVITGACLGATCTGYSQTPIVLFYLTVKFCLDTSEVYNNLPLFVSSNPIVVRSTT